MPVYDYKEPVYKKYKLRPGFTHGIADQYKAGDVVEMTEFEAIGLLDKFEPAGDGDEVTIVGHPGLEKTVGSFLETRTQAEVLATEPVSTVGSFVQAPAARIGDALNLDDVRSIRESSEASKSPKSAKASDADYSELSAAELRGVASKRGLPTTGIKADLIERLEEDDAA